MSFRVVLLFFQAEDGIRDLVRSRWLGDVYKRQLLGRGKHRTHQQPCRVNEVVQLRDIRIHVGDGPVSYTHLTLPTSDLV